jgi:hypothetical protein
MPLIHSSGMRINKLFLFLTCSILLWAAYAVPDKSHNETWNETINESLESEVKSLFPKGSAPYIKFQINDCVRIDISLKKRKWKERFPLIKQYYTWKTFAINLKFLNWKADFPFTFKALPSIFILHKRLNI